MAGSTDPQPLADTEKYTPAPTTTPRLAVKVGGVRKASKKGPRRRIDALPRYELVRKFVDSTKKGMKPLTDAKKQEVAEFFVKASTDEKIWTSLLQRHVPKNVTFRKRLTPAEVRIRLQGVLE